MRSAFVIHAPKSTALRALNYSPYLEAFRNSRRGLRSVRLGDVLETLGPAYGAVFTRIDCHPSHGIELVSQTDMFAAEPTGRVIRLDSMQHPERHRIKPWQILIAGAGTLGETELYGRSILADKRLEGKNVGPHAMVLSLKEPGSSFGLFLYAFLSTRIGISLVRSASYGTKILSVRKDVLSDLRIPEPASSVVRHVADLIKQSVTLREQYVEDLNAARAILGELPEMTQALAECGERRARCVSWNGLLPTLGAWNLASTGTALGDLQSTWKTKLGDVLTGRGVFNGPRFARIPCEEPHGIDFYSQRDLFLLRRVPRRIVHPGFNSNLLFAPEGSMLVGGHGTLGEGEIFGRVVYVSGRMVHAGFTQDLLRVQVSPEVSGLAFAYLSSPVGFRLL